MEQSQPLNGHPHVAIRATSRGAPMHLDARNRLVRSAISSSLSSPMPKFISSMPGISRWTKGVAPADPHRGRMPKKSSLLLVYAQPGCSSKFPWSNTSSQFNVTGRSLRHGILRRIL